MGGVHLHYVIDHAEKVTFVMILSFRRVVNICPAEGLADYDVLILRGTYPVGLISEGATAVHVVREAKRL